MNDDKIQTQIFSCCICRRENENISIREFVRNKKKSNHTTNGHCSLHLFGPIELIRVIQMAALSIRNEIILRLVNVEQSTTARFQNRFEFTTMFIMNQPIAKDAFCFAEKCLQKVKIQIEFGIDVNVINSLVGNNFPDNISVLRRDATAFLV